MSDKADEIKTALEGATIKRVSLSDHKESYPVNQCWVSIIEIELESGEVFSFSGETLYNTAVIERDQAK